MSVPSTFTDPYSYEALDHEYTRLCAQRDAIAEKAKPLKAKLTEAAKVAEVHRVASMEVAGELDALYASELGVEAGKGKHEFIKLKNRIGTIATLRQKQKDKRGN